MAGDSYATPAISPLAGESIERAEAERLAGVLKAIADPARLRPLSLIQSAPRGRLSVSSPRRLDFPGRPTVNHHLRILTEAGLLGRNKRGIWAHYRLVPSAHRRDRRPVDAAPMRATKKAH